MTLQLSIWNVAHGSASLLIIPNGKRFIIDLGADGQNNISPLGYIRRRGITKIDHITITHPHMDHIDDILELDNMSFGSVTLPAHLTEMDIRAGNPTLNYTAEQKLQKYLAIMSIHRFGIQPQQNIMSPLNTGDVAIKHFFPRATSKRNLNNHSVVTTVEYAGWKFLLPGDNEKPSWEELLKDTKFTKAILDTDVFLASHHGRESGYYAPLFDYFKPLITIISDGSYGATSATSSYDAVTKGMKVTKRSTGRQLFRKCVTTRKDGNIKVTVTPYRNQTTLEVTIK